MMFHLKMSLSGTWNCPNNSQIHFNTDHVFPNKILPVLDHIFSLFGAGINSLLILTIYIRYRILGTPHLSSLLLVNVCLAHLLVSANSILLYLSSKAPVSTTHLSTSYVIRYVADAVENTFRIVRVCSFLMIYIVRLLHETRPCWLLLHNRRLLALEKSYCRGVWVLGLAVGGFCTYIGLKYTRDTDFTSSGIIQYIYISIEFLSEGCHLVGMIVSIASISYLVRFLFKHRPTDRAPDSNPDQYSIYCSIKSCLQTLTLLFLIDLMFDVNLVLHLYFAMKFYFYPGCCPSLWINMLNYLGTPLNYMYSYHCPDVLHGIFSSLVFLLQKSMREKVELVWRAVRRTLKRYVDSWRDRDVSSAYI